MFDKLRNKFIVNNILISSAIILTAFVTIFTITADNLSSPHLLAATIAELDEDPTEEVHALLEERISTNNRERMADLALVLIFVGLAVEALVFAASYYMAEKSIRPIRESYAKQKEFIANASHELKTPLAIVQANFEALGTTQQPWTENIESNLSRANNLINDLLLLARADQAKKIIQKTPTNIADLIAKQVSCFEPQLTTKSLELNLQNDLRPSICTADLTQIIHILIDNAIKYSHHRIKITLAAKTLTIANDGKTIPKSKLNKIFDRFYQVDKTSKGSGLGLAIARELSLKNGWQLSATSRRRLITLTLVL